MAAGVHRIGEGVLESSPQPALVRVAAGVSLRTTSAAAAARSAERCELEGCGGMAREGSGEWSLSPQPALVRVAARGQPSGHLASGDGASGSGVAMEGAATACWKQGMKCDKGNECALVRVAAGVHRIGAEVWSGGTREGLDSKRCRHSPRSCGWLRGVSLRATSSAAAALGLESGASEGRACVERRGMGEAAPSPQPALARVAVRG